MSNLLMQSDINLGRAGWFLFLEIAVGVVLGISLEHFGLSAGYVIPGVWLANLVAAWYLAKAASDLGKSKILYGLLSALGPPLAVALFSSLYNQNALIRLAKRHSER